MEKVKDFVKEHKCELIALGTGIMIGYVVVKRRSNANMTDMKRQINEDLMRMFIDAEGNFMQPDGLVRIPQLVK